MTSTEKRLYRAARQYVITWSIGSKKSLARAEKRLQRAAVEFSSATARVFKEIPNYYEEDN